MRLQVKPLDAALEEVYVTGHTQALAPDRLTETLSPLNICRPIDTLSPNRSVTMSVPDRSWLGYEGAISPYEAPGAFHRYVCRLVPQMGVCDEKWISPPKGASDPWRFDAAVGGYHLFSTV